MLPWPASARERVVQTRILQAARPPWLLRGATGRRPADHRDRQDEKLRLPLPHKRSGWERREKGGGGELGERQCFPFLIFCSLLQHVNDTGPGFKRLFVLPKYYRRAVLSKGPKAQKGIVRARALCRPPNPPLPLRQLLERGRHVMMNP